jgi:mannose-6-phosphate isomerase-like protein (cupin superfamily)
LAQSGSGLLLLANGKTQAICVGEVVRFAENEVHGIENTGVEAFEYLSVTAPPIDFTYAYANKGA